VNFDVAPQFERALKRLKKKFPSIKEDIVRLQKILNENPHAGISLGAGLYKIRLASSDMKKGKRSGFRVVYFVFLSNDLIVLLDIYTKNVRETVSLPEVRRFLEEYHSQGFHVGEPKVKYGVKR